jgi:hypothetical protein
MWLCPTRRRTPCKVNVYCLGAKTEIKRFRHKTLFRTNKILMRIYEQTVFRRVRKIAKSDYHLRHFCPSVCPSLRNRRLPMDGFSLIWYLNIFRKSVHKIQVSLKSDKHNGYITWTPIYAYEHNLAHFFLEWEMFQKKRCRENQNSHFMFNFFPRKSCRKWQNVEKCCTAGQATDHSMAHAHCILDT